MTDSPRPADRERVRSQLLELQDAICDALAAADGSADFRRDAIEGERGGLARPRVLEGGALFEKAAVMFSHTKGERLPEAATARRPELAGRSFEAVSVSLITHPRNPYVPTSHANFRFFIASAEGQEPAWWFGGGYDLTPYYGFDEDAVHWHRTARGALAPFGDELYPVFKRQCDEYFYLPHRDEPRGVGGVFYDDFNELGFARSFEVHQAVSGSYLTAYLPIVERRKALPFGERERSFQLYRRGRYAEFNLAWDRGTRFGLQARGRAESILASLPPEVHWRYDWSPEPGSPEAHLHERFLVPRDWAAEAD